MKVPFSERPGRHERHFRRKIDNPLMPRVVSEHTPEQLLEVQRMDHEELLIFLDTLRKKVKQAVDLKANEESQILLDLKAELEKLYETASSLADDHSDNKAAIRQLIAVIMDTVRRGAVGDTLAAQELAQEEQARSMHFELLEFPLIADLLHPDSVIEEDELLPVLLWESEQQVKEALTLFDPIQLQQMCAQADALLQEKSADKKYWQRFSLMQKML